MAHVEQHFILGVHITDRLKKASDVQALMSKYGCNIRTRLGLHDVSGDFCSPNGLVLLELVGDPKTCNELAEKLAAIPGVEVQRMVFGHPPKK